MGRKSLNPLQEMAQQILNEHSKTVEYTEAELQTIKRFASLASYQYPLQKWLESETDVPVHQAMVERTIPKASTKIKQAVVEVLDEMHGKPEIN